MNKKKKKKDKKKKKKSKKSGESFFSSDSDDDLNIVDTSLNTSVHRLLGCELFIYSFALLLEYFRVSVQEYISRLNISN